MSLSFTSLNSGSNGNCYYVASQHEAVLIDAGISCRETERRMARLGLAMQKVKAIFISHEHSDHIKGVEVLASKYCIPVYITAATLRSSRLTIDNSLLRDFRAYDATTIGDLSITAFPKFHDASEPHSFVVSGHGVNIGVLTDIGVPCSHVAEQFSKCNAAFLEANYDDEMLHNGHYPFHLKRRISGGKGHLSNKQALDLFLKCRSSSLSHIILSHLSKENNCPDLVQQLFASYAGSTTVTVASRYEETPLFSIGEKSMLSQSRKEAACSKHAFQASLF